MIIPTMSYAEIISEIKQDIPYIFELSEKKDQKVKRLVQKSAIFPFRLHSFVSSRNHNRWLLTWEAHTRKNHGDNILFSMACIFNNANGRFVVMPYFQDGHSLSFIIFLPHFFQRFAERMHLSLTGEDLIRRYLQYNINFSIKTKEVLVSHTKKAIEVQCTSAEGVALGYQLLDGSFFFKTFISYEMAKGNQIEDFAKSEENRQEYYDDFINKYLIK